MHATLTGDPLHPGGVVNAQVVVEDLEDVAQDDAEVLRGERGAAQRFGLRVVRSHLPPVGQVVTQHGQDHLDHLGRIHRGSPSGYVER